MNKENIVSEEGIAIKLFIMMQGMMHVVDSWKKIYNLATNCVGLSIKVKIINSSLRKGMNMRLLSDLRRIPKARRVCHLQNM